VGPSDKEHSGKPAYDRFLVYNEIKKKVLEEGPNVVPFIRELLREREDDLCILGCIAAGKIGDKSFVKHLLILLTDKNLDVSSHAASALIAIGKTHPEVITKVLTKFRRLPKSSASVEQLEWGKVRCIYILRNLKAKESAGDIIAALSDNSQRVRLSAVNALTEMGAKEAIPQIVPLLRNREENRSIRFRSAVALGELNAIQAADDLILALKDDLENIRWGAAMAFKKIKAPKAISALVDAITDKSQKVSAEAIRALYFQTGKKLTTDFLRKDAERQKAQKKWRTWWQQNKDKFN
jgi:HEAT repeat protein